MNGIKVYPFAPSKKLYYVQGEFSENISGYVKASCGGTEISASWIGQQVDEFYMINNPEEEKITVKTTGTVEYIPAFTGAAYVSYDLASGNLGDRTIYNVCTDTGYAVSDDAILWVARVSVDGTNIYCATVLSTYPADGESWCEPMLAMLPDAKASIVSHLDSNYFSYDLVWAIQNSCTSPESEASQPFTVYNAVPK